MEKWNACVHGINYIYRISSTCLSMKSLSLLVDACYV